MRSFPKLSPIPSARCCPRLAGRGSVAQGICSLLRACEALLQQLQESCIITVMRLGIHQGVCPRLTYGRSSEKQGCLQNISSQWEHQFAVMFRVGEEDDERQDSWAGDGWGTRLDDQ